MDVYPAHKVLNGLNGLKKDVERPKTTRTPDDPQRQKLTKTLEKLNDPLTMAHPVCTSNVTRASGHPAADSPHYRVPLSRGESMLKKLEKKLDFSLSSALALPKAYHVEEQSLMILAPCLLDYEATDTTSKHFMSNDTRSSH
ncbi:hypothetical protein NQ318_013888 [Aromia moschata]|uniref:Uncharacterized protein n=1 Tax=Aromia moschata TaxID=1265417 RepID=A0AAV8Z9C4_9CUCU|nr:hypothetical protein NQ318_013888 [Aromia moschata]